MVLSKYDTRQVRNRTRLIFKCRGLTDFYKVLIHAIHSDRLRPAETDKVRVTRTSKFWYICL
jgi:hypothetical protein